MLYDNKKKKENSSKRFLNEQVNNTIKKTKNSFTFVLISFCNKISLKKTAPRFYIIMNVGSLSVLKSTNFTKTKKNGITINNCGNNQVILTRFESQLNFQCMM